MLSQFRFGLLILILLFSLDALADTALVDTTKPKSCRTVAGSKDGSLSASLCDVGFGAIPSYACGGALPETGVYTITNNTPVTMPITVSLIVNDLQPAGDASITGNTCGSTLAPGASCTVTITLTTIGPFNRILQIGTSGREAVLDSPVITPTVGCTTPAPVSPDFLCALNSLSGFATLGGQTITNTGNTVINGNLGLSPGTSVTGFPPGVVNGTMYIADGVAATAQTDFTTLYTCLADQTINPCTTTLGTADLAGQTLSPGVYCSGSTMTDSGVLTLDGGGDANSVFIFQVGSSLTMGSGSSIVLTNGAKSANVFWQIGASATLVSTTAFQGTLVTLLSNSLGKGATVVGRVLSGVNGSVTYIDDTVTLPQ